MKLILIICRVENLNIKKKGRQYVTVRLGEHASRPVLADSTRKVASFSDESLELAVRKRKSKGRKVWEDLGVYYADGSGKSLGEGRMDVGKLIKHSSAGEKCAVRISLCGGCMIVGFVRWIENDGRNQQDLDKFSWSSVSWSQSSSSSTSFSGPGNEKRVSFTDQSESFSAGREQVARKKDSQTRVNKWWSREEESRVARENEGLQEIIKMKKEEQKVDCAALRRENEWLVGEVERLRLAAEREPTMGAVMNELTYTRKMIAKRGTSKMGTSKMGTSNRQ